MLRIRRARRTDFTAAMALMASTGMVLPVPDRRTLRRFRQIVADLGGDFYLAMNDEQPVGLVHVTYTRQLAAPPRAHLDQLLVAASSRRQGVGTALLDFARRRARRRGCAFLACHLRQADPQTEAFLDRTGLQRDGETLLAPLEPIA